MSDHLVTPNSIFQGGNSFTEFFIVLQNKETQIKAILKYIGGYRKEVGTRRLGRYSVSPRCCLMTSLMLGLADMNAMLR